MEDVAAEAGIAKGTLYLYFSSKEDIYAAAVVHAMDQLGHLAEEKLAGVTSFRERLTALIKLRLEFWFSQRDLYRMLLTVGREPQHRKQTQMMILRAAKSLTDVMEEGVREGELKKQNFLPIALAIVDMMRGVNERRMDGFSKNSPKQEAIGITRIALAALGAEEKKPSGSRRARA